MKQTFDLLQTPVQFAKGVGPYLASLLQKMGIKTLEDLLYHFPHRYLDRQKIYSIREAPAGAEAVVCGTLVTFGEMPLGKSRRKIFQAVFSDESGFIQAKWFNYYAKQMGKNFKKGKKAFLAGKVDFYRGEKQIVHPEIEWCDEGEEEGRAAGIVPIYPLTEGIYQKQLRRILNSALEKILPSLFETLPESLLQKYQWMTYSRALQEIHSPTLGDEVEALNLNASLAHQRLIFDEFFFLELGLALKRKGSLKEEGISLETPLSTLDSFYKTLPFKITKAQERVIQEIAKDLAQDRPMHRLLQGDVGSGKTLVAMAAALLALSAGHQVCLMAPTEILAEQHARSLAQFLEPLGISTALIKSDLSSPEKKERLQKIAEGKIQIAVGTHALIQEEVEFASLALAIIDEQHRFGVLQRAALKKKGKNPHLLVMTATPIPRTLSMTAYGDLDVSILDELPAGRKPIFTRVVYEKELFKLHQFMRQEIQKGRQAYVVYPLIEESEVLELKNATRMYERLKKEIFSDFQVGLLHGQMKGDEKEKIIQDFIQNKIQILVATTVIEVGVDVPNATLMVIEHAERFGLSQLHQMRGRVGRGAEKSYCFLVAAWPQSDLAKERLKIMCQTTDGFKIAEADLELRGPGDFLGTRQSGIPDFRIANIVRDAPLLENARKEAFGWLESDPHLTSPESQNMKKILFHRWKGRLNLAEIG